MSANRTNSSPPGPNPTPGDTATSHSSTRCVANSIEPMSRYGSGMRAHANIVPPGLWMSQPMRCRPSYRASRRDS
ncbi:Uncharacterised protein [Mycobacteroides abscessus]|nr:Uncharacterised protein [Mycobacteroides abscessus]